MLDEKEKLREKYIRFVDAQGKPLDLKSEAEVCRAIHGRNAELILLLQIRDALKEPTEQKNAPKLTDKVKKKLRLG